ncbi:metallophosphoesterase [Olivibacter sp. SDN3]|uniref:metallophosphoesterase n=1 Tax=Olivibacter sp. SDN3 TaxID=2764720 RepID=UPI0016516DF3|nr:metallophosphoesterase [Olivibacter sp. SDN3]QNL50170.1 metallophosphoesterase [Olivibacter sp. SDN3]
MLSRILFIIPIWIIVDLYFFQALKSVVGHWQLPAKQTIYWAYWMFDLLLILFILYLSFIDSKIIPTRYGFLFVGFVFISIIPKLFALPFLLLEDLTRLGSYIVHYSSEKTYPERRRFIGQLILGISTIPFGAIIYGMAKGKYNYKVHRSTLYFKDLPQTFDGFTITQLSDIHCGSFTDHTAVKRGIELANAQKSDLMVLTGDLVNNEAEELDEWQSTLARLSAPLGVYSVLGNHDYGDYIAWPSSDAKQANLNRLKTMQREMGFRLLMDEHVKIEKNGQFFNLVGIQNWGKSFAQYGDLHKSMQTVEENTFSVLLSHDPTHWEAQALQHPKPIHLTLAGHTHGMQFGIEIPGLRWSPVKYIYKQWAGVYKIGFKYINVNRGFGFIGFSGRVGIWPEISVITLRKG